MKNSMNTRELEKLLTPTDRPQPPADLAAKIQAEIPELDPFELAEDKGSGILRFERPSTARRLRPYALAASLLVTAGASFFVYRHSIEVTEVPVSGETQIAENVPSPEPLPTADAAPKADDERLRQRREEINRKKLELRNRLEKIAVRPDTASPSEVASNESQRRSESLRSPEPAVSESSMVGAATAVPQTRRLMPASPAPASAPPPPPPPALPSSGARAFRGNVVPSGVETFVPDMEIVAPDSKASPSTGGTAEPNDQPYGDVFFEDYGTNPFIDTEDDRLSTFGLDVDTASYTVVRRFLHEGHLPPHSAVRVEEMINYFDYGDAPPMEDDFAIHAEGAPSPFGENERYYLMRFHLHGREVAAKARPGADLTFVVDVSGSMGQENRLGLVKKALELLLGELRSDDRVALVVYGSQGRVLLEHTNDHALIRRAIEQLVPSGSTNAEEGLVLAYQLAARRRLGQDLYAEKERIHRVILCSDGVANVGRTGPQSILEQVASHAADGVELTTVGFGMGNYNDVLMEQLADRGNGRYAYVDTLDEARRIFVENLTGTLHTIAAEARVQVEWNEDVVSRYRLIGYENRDIPDERFRDDTVDAGEIGAGHTVTALYELKLTRRPRRGDEIGTLHLRFASRRAGSMTELERRVTGRDFAPSWKRASAALRLTSLVAEFGEILKGSYWAKKGELNDVFRRAQAMSAEFPGDHDVAELVGLMSRAARIEK